MKSVRVIIDALFFTFLGIFLGFLVDLVFPEPKESDSTVFLIILTFVQIVLTIYISFLIDSVYSDLIGIDSDTYLGFTAFTIIFFLVQQQLLTRLAIVYNRLTGRKL